MRDLSQLSRLLSQINLLESLNEMLSDALVVAPLVHFADFHCSSKLVNTFFYVFQHQVCSPSFR